MSLMSDIRGTPERVWSLVRLLDAYDGELPREEVFHWLDPLGTDEKGTAVDNTIGAARSLALISADEKGSTLRLDDHNLPKDIDGFSDWVHARLVGLPSDHADAIVLTAFAWFIAMSGKHRNTTWLKKSGNDIADSIRHDLASDGEASTFNVTRYPRWRDWIQFLGLGFDMPVRGGTVFYPHVTERMERVIVRDFIHVFDAGADIEAEGFLEHLAEAMPYVDEGRLFKAVAARVDWASQAKQLSPVTSTALRDLHDDGRIELVVRGDERQMYQLTPDPAHRISAFSFVRLTRTGTVDG